MTGNCEPSNQRGVVLAVLPVAVLTLAVLSGCTRAFYRQTADEQAYQILDEKNHDPRWHVPSWDITPDPRSRLYDPYNPDDPPLPPDDPAAHQYMHHVYGMRGSKKWHKLSRLKTIENPLWPTYLGAPPLVEPGETPAKIENLTLAQAVELGLLHSREYQEQLENVYLAALALTGERYEFDVRPIGFLGEPGTDLFFHHQPDDETSWKLGPSHFGLSKLFPTGAQLVAELANNTVWLLSGNGGRQSATTLAYTLVQPLLAGGTREVVLERLTQAERNVLYAMRDFARFRKEFYVMVVTGERAIPLPHRSSQAELAFLIRGERSPTVGFNFLLARLQLFRNYQAKVASLERQLEDLQALAKKGQASDLNVTQVQTSLEGARYTTIVTERRFQDELDRFKLQLGLPPDLELTLDDSLLQPFQFTDPELAAFEKQVRAARETIDQTAPDASSDQWLALTDQLDGFWSKARQRLSDTASKVDRLLETAPARRAHLLPHEWKNFQHSVDQIAHSFPTFQHEFEQAFQQWQRFKNEAAAQLGSPQQRARFKQSLLQWQDQLAGLVRRLSDHDMAVRVELVTLKPIDVTAEEAVRLALKYRLDLMNQRAIVMDVRRRLELAADRLKATLDLVAEGEINTPDLSDNDDPFRFRADESDFRVGLRLVTPLDRRRQRNNFRAAQIAYQRARRNYMAAEDQVKLDVRQRWREMESYARSFEVRRQQLRTALRELRQALEQQDGQPVADSSGQQGVNITRAIDNIELARNSMVFIWEDYEKARLALFRFGRRFGQQ